MADRIKGITIEIGGDTTGLSKALSGVNKEIKDTQTQLKDVEKLLKLDPGNTELLAQKHKLLAESVKETKDKLETLKVAAEQADKALADGTINQEQYDGLKREIADTEQKLKSLEEQAKNSNVALEKIGAIGEKFKDVGDKLTSAGQAMMPVTGAIVGIGAAAVKTTADFDSAMANVAAISGATGADFDALRDKAREMGEQTKFSASDSADAMSYMAMAGWKTNDMLDGISGIMNLAAASGEDLATTSDIVTDALTAFGLKAEDSGHFADIMASASSNANTNVSLLGETFKYVAPVAGALGYSAEDCAVAIGLMANSGIKGSQAGTSLRSVLSRMAKPTKETQIAMDKLGVSLTDSNGNMKSLDEVMGDMRKGFSGLTEEEQAMYASMLGGKAAMSGLLAIANASEEDFNGLGEAINNCDGTAQNMADTMNDTLSGQLQILKSQLQELAIKIGDALMPTIRNIVAKIQEWITWLNSLDAGTRNTIITIGLVVAAIGPLLIVIGQMATGIGAIMTVISTLGPALAAFGAAGGPILLVVAAFGLMIDAMSKSKSISDEYAEKVSTLTADEEANKKAVDDMTASYETMNDQRQTAMQNAENQAAKEEYLLEKLKSICDENGNVKEGYEDEAATITGQLADALGIEIGLVDDQIQNYKELCGGIDELIEKKKANALLSANEAAYNEAMNGWSDAYMAYNQAKKDVEDTTWAMLKAQEEESRLQEEINGLWQQNIDTGADVTDQSSKLSEQQQAAAGTAEGLKAKLESLNGTLEDAESTYVGYSTTIANYDGLNSAIMSNEADQINAAVLRIKEGFETAETSTRESLARQVETFTQEYQEMKAAVEAGAPGITQANVDEMANLVTLSKAELDKLAPNASASVIDVAAAISGNSKAMSDAGQQLGVDFTDGYGLGIENSQTTVADKATDTANAALDAVQTAQNSHSPSKVTEGFGQDFSDGYALGISEGSEGVTTAVNTVVTGATTALQNALQTSQTATTTYQGSMTAAWTSWATGLVTSITTTMAQIAAATSTGMATTEQTIAQKNTSIQTTWKTTWKSIEDEYKKTMDTIQRITTETLGMVERTNKDKTETIRKDTETAMVAMVTAIDTEAKKIDPTIQDGWAPAIAYLEALPAKSRKWGQDFMEGLIQGIHDRMSELEEAVEEISEMISDYTHFSRPEKGPLRDYEEWMPDMMYGMAKGIKDYKHLVEEEMQSLAAGMTIGAQQRTPINLSTNSTILLDGKVLATTVDEYLGGEY